MATFAKKITVFLLAALMLFTFASCGEKVSIAAQEDLAGLHVGVMEGSSGAAYAADLGLEVTSYTSMQLAAEDLANKKIDAILMGQDAAKALISSNEKITYLGETLTTETYKAAVTDSDILDELNSVIAELKEVEIINSILNYHVNGNTEVFPPAYSFEGYESDLTAALCGENPLTYTNEAGEQEGIDVDIVNAVANSSMMAPVFKTMSQSDALSALQTGTVDLVLSCGDESQDLSGVLYSDVYYDASLVIVMRSSSAK